MRRRNKPAKTHRKDKRNRKQEKTKKILGLMTMAGAAFSLNESGGGVWVGRLTVAASFSVWVEGGMVAGPLGASMREH